MKNIILTFTALLLLETNFAPVYSQQEEKHDFRQYLFPAFSVSVVKSSNSKPSKLLLNYNTITENMVFLQNSQYFDLVTSVPVDTIYMNDKKFIPLEDFYVELVYEGAITFAIQHRSNLKEPGVPAGYGTTSQTSAAGYVSNVKMKSGIYNINIPKEYEIEYSPVYWIYKNGKWNKYFSESQLIKLFPEKSKEIRQFIKENRIKFDKPADLAKLAAYCNELYR